MFQRNVETVTRLRANEHAYRVLLLSEPQVVCPTPTKLIRAISRRQRNVVGVGAPSSSPRVFHFERVHSGIMVRP